VLLKWGWYCVWEVEEGYVICFLFVCRRDEICANCGSQWEDNRRGDSEEQKEESTDAAGLCYEVIGGAKKVMWIIGVRKG